MKAKILVVLFVVLLSAGSASFAGDDYKPFKGHVQAGEFILIDPADYPFLANIIAELGTPSSWPGLEPRLVTAEGYTNVGGNSVFESAQIYYFWPYDPTNPYARFVLLFFEDVTITCANGDQIFLEVTGIFYSSIGTFIDKGQIVGGTGRFEGAEGEFIGTSDGFEGHIMTVGKTKKQK